MDDMPKHIVVEEGGMYPRVKYAYMLCVGTKFMIDFNRVRVMRRAAEERHKDHDITIRMYAMKRSAYGDGGWDAPTFRSCACCVIHFKTMAEMGK